MNEKIKISQIRLIGQEGQQLGVVSPAEGLKLAKEAGLDLVEVAPDAAPPVCRIMDYVRYRYEQTRKNREAKKKQKVVHLKEIRIKPNIEEHDYQVKLNHLTKFLKRGDKAKVTMFFRGRQMAHVDLGRKVLDRLATDVSTVGELETAPRLDGKMITMIIKPKK